MISELGRLFPSLSSHPVSPEGLQIQLVSASP